MFPPGQEHLFQDSLHNTVYDIDSAENAKKFPNFDKAIKFVLFQNPGETLFVPSGWWHQVQNIGDTISINHNWCNGSNLDLLLESITSDLKDVERAIDHLKEMMDEHEWIETCQNMLLLNSGWDWATIWQMCTTIRDRILVQRIRGDSVISESSTATASTDPKRAPLFPPPLLSQQPALDVTLKRLDIVLDHIRSIPSASWFLTHVKGISVDK